MTELRQVKRQRMDLYINQRRTSVRIEKVFSDYLKERAADMQISKSRLVSRIVSQYENNANRSAAVRTYCFEDLQARLEKAEAKANAKT